MWARDFSVRPSAPTGTETLPASRSIRKLHRRLGILFTLTVLANFAAMTLGQPSAWIAYSPLLPLFLLMLSGLSMLALPYVAARRAAN